MVKEDLRIGVFVCDCGSNIAGFLDTEAVREFAESLPEEYRVVGSLMPALKSTRLVNHLPTAIIGCTACVVALGLAIMNLRRRKWWPGVCVAAVGVLVILALRSTWLESHDLQTRRCEMAIDRIWDHKIVSKLLVQRIQSVNI